MHSRILSPLEERQIRSYLKHDGDKTLNIRVLATRARQRRKMIQDDAALIDQFLRHYEIASKPRTS